MASFTTNAVYAAKLDSSKKNATKLENKQENKQIAKETDTLSKKLYQIEESYKKVDLKIEEYFSTIGNATTGDSAQTTDTGNVEDQSEEEQSEEYENEDTQVSNSFYGKLNAIMNRLNTVKRQLSRYSSSDSEDISKLNGITDELMNQVKASMDKLSNLQSANVTSLKSKSDKRTMEDQSINEQKKSWKIHFNKAIDPSTINGKNIMIVDSQNNIVDVDFSYNKDTNDIIIEAKDGFTKSENYSILISSDVKSIDGKKLPKTIEKRFTVQ